MQYDLVKSLSGKGRVWISLLRHQGKPIAARMGFRFNDHDYDYLSGLERHTNEADSRRYSGAGVSLLVSAVERSIDKGCYVFDMLRGDEPYKLDLTPTVPRNYNLSIRSRRISERRRPDFIHIWLRRLAGASDWRFFVRGAL